MLLSSSSPPPPTRPTTRLTGSNKRKKKLTNIRFYIGCQLFEITTTLNSLSSHLMLSMVLLDLLKCIFIFYSSSALIYSQIHTLFFSHTHEYIYTNFSIFTSLKVVIRKIPQTKANNQHLQFNAEKKK